MTLGGEAAGRAEETAVLLANYHRFGVKSAAGRWDVVCRLAVCHRSVWDRAHRSREELGKETCSRCWSFVFVKI